MSEGLFRFEGLCSGGSEWFLRDNAGLETVAEQMGIRGTNKGEAVPSTSTGSGGSGRASHRQEGFLRGLAGEPLGPHLVGDKASPGLVGLCPLCSQVRELVPQLTLQGVCAVASSGGWGGTWPHRR